MVGLRVTCMIVLWAHHALGGKWRRLRIANQAPEHPPRIPTRESAPHHCTVRRTEAEPHHSSSTIPRQQA